MNCFELAILVVLLSVGLVTSANLSQSQPWFVVLIGSLLATGGAYLSVNYVGKLDGRWNKHRNSKHRKQIDLEGLMKRKFFRVSALPAWGLPSGTSVLVDPFPGTPRLSLGRLLHQYDRFGNLCRTVEVPLSGSRPPPPVPATPLVEYIRGSDYRGGIGGILYTLRRPAPNVPAAPRLHHYNARGDVIAQSDAAGRLLWQGAYLAYGTHPVETGTNPERQRANTKEEDKTGLLNEGRRYRCLETGSFITRDPAGFVDGPNLYAYTNQNPWSKFDPEGLEIKEIDRINKKVVPKVPEQPGNDLRRSNPQRV